MKRLLILLTAVLLLGILPAAGLAETASNAVPSSAELQSTYTAEQLTQLWVELGALLRANGTYPFTELEKGDVGVEVTALQTRLKELGYYTKEVVDNFGNGTYNAMREFEKANGLKVNGVASAEDQKVLYSSAAVAYSADSASNDDDDDDDDSGSYVSSSPDATSGATAAKP